MALKIESLRMVLPVVVGSAIPMFFVVVYLRSTFNRLASLRGNCRRAAADLWGALAHRRRAARGLAEEILRRGSNEDSRADKVRAAQQALGAALGVSAPVDSAPERPAHRFHSALDQVETALRTLEQLSATIPSLGDLEPDGGLRRSLVETKATLASALEHYNGAVLLYNASRERGSGRLWALLCGWPRATAIAPSAAANLPAAERVGR